MASQKNIIRHLRACYEADNREASIFNLKDRKVSHLHFTLRGGEFLNGNLDVVPIERELGMAIDKAAKLNKREKTLVFCAFMVVGKPPRSSKRTPARLFAPLIFFPATVEIFHMHAELQIDRQRQRINSRLLSLLLDDDSSISGPLNDLLSQIPETPFDPDQIRGLADALHDSAPKLNIDGLASFPTMIDDRGITAARRRLAGAPFSLSAHCACAMALIPNSPDTRGVLTELRQIATRASFSAPLSALLGDISAKAPEFKSQPPDHPASASLSRAQNKALKSAARHPLTVLVGPPGTGKSYTIAAIALDHIIRGERVLIASKMTQPLAVIEQKIAELAGSSDFVVSGGKANYKKELCQYIEDILQGYGLASVKDCPADENWSSVMMQRQLGALEDIHARIQSVEKSLQRRTHIEMKWGRAKSDSPSGIFRLMFRGYQLWRADRKLAPMENYWSALAQYEEFLDDQSRTLSESLLYSINYWRRRALKSHRNDLKRLSRSLRARTHRKQEEWFDKINQSILFRSFPVWMAPLSDMATCVPLRKELFDLAIVDEATQCDMASCLPVFQRAKRAVITGDPKQLRHVSFLSRERQRLIARQYSLSEDELEIHNFRDKSILDLMNERIDSQQQVVLLDEHFRSRPQIISFSNREFYRGSLKIMTERPGQSNEPAVAIRRVEGNRDESGRNPIEAKALVEELAAWVENEEELDRSVCHSLGVLSPFRDQVECIFSLLSERFTSAQIEKHNLIVGTAHSFQGEERDIMFLSFALDADSHNASFRFLNRPDVFNVSITRAKALQFVYTSVAPRKAPAGTLLAKYLADTRGAPSRAKGKAKRDAFLKDVSEALAPRGFHSWPGYPIAGQTIDLLVEKNGKPLGIDLIGHPGVYEDAFELEHYRLFRRAGLRLFPLPYSAWHKDRDSCLTAIEQWIAD